MRFIVLAILLTGYACAECDPVELVEYRALLTKECLENDITEYKCNKELAELRIMEQDAQIKMDWIKALHKYRTKITTLELEK